MSINEVTPMWSRGGGGVQSSDGKKFTASYNAAYQVTHSPGESIDSILAADGIPRLRSVYQGTSFVYCTQVGDVQPVGPVMSIVPVRWEGEVSEDGRNPIDQKAAWKLVSAATQEETDTDGNGMPLTNTIGEPVEGHKKEIWDWKLNLTQNFLGFNSYVMQAYANAVNGDAFGPPGNVWPAGTARLQQISIDPKGDEGEGYFSVGASVLFRTPVNTSPLTAWWHRYRNEGNYERVGTTVTFADAPPGGSTAAGHAVVNSSGAITAIVVTAAGSGYVSPPAVTIAGNGSGATATASINYNGQVTSVAVGSGGSDYKSKLVRAVDDQKEPVRQPVLLAADGTRLHDSGEAYFVERPRYSYYLPFSALGFNF